LAVVDPGSASTTPPDVKAFWGRLRELGYIEGQNLVVESRWAETHLDRLPALMNEVLAHKVDVLITWSTPGAIAARNATSTTPIVAAAMGDPVGSGLAASLAHPGGNLTGMSVGWGQGMGGKWLELLQETVPRLYTVAVTVNRDLKVHRDMVSELEAIAPTRGVKLQFLDVRNPQALDGAFEQARRTAQAVLVLGDPITVNNRTKVTTLASKHQLPTLYSMREFVVDGGLMGYGFDSVTMYRSTADYVDKILKGAKPAELPIEQVSRYLLVVNLGTAKALKLSFPESILLRADEVIK
jgi:putative ABC transport system substrate-binding protein